MWFPILIWSILKPPYNSFYDISGWIKTSTNHQIQTASFMQTLQTDDSRTFFRTWICFPHSSPKHEFLQSKNSPQQKHWLSKDSSKFVPARQKLFSHLQEIITCVEQHHLKCLLASFYLFTVVSTSYFIWKRKFSESFKFLLRISSQVHIKKRTIKSLWKMEEVLAINHWDWNAKGKDLYCLFTFS